MKRAYRRHLPHQIPEDTPIFVTFCLKGAIPKRLRLHLEKERQRLQSRPNQKLETPIERRSRIEKILFGILDGEMDRSPVGPLHLKDERCARIVESAILFGAGSRYDLLAWCIMVNHVHVLLKPRADFQKLMQGMKGYSAYEANQLLNTAGQHFWLDESYDHWPRDDEELFRILEYIEANPVAAGLCRLPSDWHWSSARRRKNWAVGTPYVPDVGQAFLPDSVATPNFCGQSPAP